MRKILKRENRGGGACWLCAFFCALAWIVLFVGCDRNPAFAEEVATGTPVPAAVETAATQGEITEAEAEKETTDVEASADGIVYVENAWNFVEEAMDVSHGIPEYATGVLAKIRDRGVLRVATEPYFPPQEFLDGTKSGQEAIIGSDIEMAKLIADRMGVTLELIPLDFSDVLPAVAEGTADLAISAFSYTPGRASAYEMSKGYHFAPESAGSGLVIRQENAEILQGLESLADQVIVAQSGSLQEALLAGEIKEYLEFRRVGTARMVYEMVADGIAAAGVVDIESADYYFADTGLGGELMIMPGVRFQLSAEMDGDRVAAKKGEIQLMYFVNGVINELLESGQYETWYQAYLNYGGAQ